MRIESWIAGALTMLVTVGTGAQEQHRELGAHEHGHSTLNVAIEGTEVAMELIAPGADIVGFEHEAASAQDKAALAAAEAKLADPLSLFAMPAQAECILQTASVEIEGEHHADEAHHDEAGEHETDEHEAEHNEFHASYRLACASPDELGRIRFDYFDAFPNAMEVEVNVITEKGQSSFEVERDAPILDLVGLV